METNPSKTQSIQKSRNNIKKNPPKHKKLATGAELENEN